MDVFGLLLADTDGLRIASVNDAASRTYTVGKLCPFEERRSVRRAATGTASANLR